MDQIKIKLTLSSPAGWGEGRAGLLRYKYPGIKYAKLPVRGEVSLYLSVSFKCILTPNLGEREPGAGLGEILIVTRTDGARGGGQGSDRNIGPSFVIRLR